MCVLDVICIFTAQNMIRNFKFTEDGDVIIFQWKVLDECRSLNIKYTVKLFQSKFEDVIETTETKATFPRKAAPCSEVTAEVRVILEDYDQYERPFTYTTGEYRRIVTFKMI